MDSKGRGARGAPHRNLRETHMKRLILTFKIGGSLGCGAQSRLNEGGRGSGRAIANREVKSLEVASANPQYRAFRADR